MRLQCRKWVLCLIVIFSLQALGMADFGEASYTRIEPNKSSNPVLIHPITNAQSIQSVSTKQIESPNIPVSVYYSQPAKTLEQRKEEIYRSVDIDKNCIHDELDQVITEKQDNGTAEELLELVIAVEDGSLDNAIDAFESLGGIMGRRLDGPAFYGFSGSIASSKILEVSNLGTVEMMELVHEMKRNSDTALQLTNVRSYIWDELGYTGDWNSSIAVLDTGIDDTHPMLSPWNNLSFTDGKVVGWYDATPDGSTSPEDYNSHGSHCAGIAAGFEYNVTDSDNRTQSTWGIKYDYPSPAEGHFVYYIEVKNKGWINVTTWWNGTGGDTSDAIYLLDPDDSIVDQVTGSLQNRNLSYYVSNGETGIYSVWVHVDHKLNGIFWATGLNKYPYSTPPVNHGMFGGVAPDTRIVAVKIFNNAGNGYSTDMIKALNWVTTHAEDYHIIAASMSVSFSGTVPSVDTAVAALAYHGVIPVISAGNDGQGDNNIHSPGHVDECICVGATGDYNQITSYSSEGPGYGNLTKPDLVAPGGVSTQGAILSVDSNDQEADNGFREQQPDDMAIMQGTSMSTPHVAGLVALLAQAMGGAASWDWNSATQPFKMKQLLMITSYEVYSLNRGGKDTVEGYGRVCPDAALEAYLYPLSIGNTYKATFDNGAYGRKAWARHVSLVSGTTYTFSLEVPDNADFDLYLYSGSHDAHGEPILLAKSVNTTLGGLEQLKFTPSSTDTYYIVAKYMTGLGGQFEFNVTAGTPPTIILVSPANNSIQQNGVLVDFEITDIDGDLSTVYYHWDSDPWIEFSSPYETNTPTGDSGHYLYVNATDDYNNFNYSTFYFTIDNTAPTVLLQSPTNNTIQKSSTLVNISVSDTNLGDVSIKWNDNSWELWDSPYDTNLPSGDGFQTLHVNASDLAGNYNYTIFMFTTDNTNPSIILNSPVNNTVHKSGTLIDVSISDNNLDSVQSKWDGGSWSPWPSPYDTNIPSGDGPHTLYINATDKAGNSNYTILVFIVDNTNPDIVLESPLNNTIHMSSTLVNFTISDSNLNTVYMKWDSGSWIELDSPYDTTLPSGDGPHTLYVNATDSAGNYNYSIYIFTVDDENPTVILVSPSNNTVQKGNTLVNVSSSDANLASVQYKWDTGSWSSWSSPYDTYLPFDDGSHTLYVNATDEAGNYNYSIFVFTADNTNPSVNLVSPANNTIHNGGTTINVSISDFHLFDVQYKWDIESWGPWSLPYDTILPSIDDSHILYVNATDEAGNFNYSFFIFTTDDTNPLVVLVKPTNNTVHNSGFTIDLAISDTNLGLVQYKWDTDSWAPLSTPYDTSLPIGAGLHILHINATDSANNENYSLFLFTTDDVVPSITLNSPSNETVHNSGTLIDLAISDTNLGFVQYKWDASSWIELTSPYDTSLPIDDIEHTLYINATDLASNYNYTYFVFTTDDMIPSVLLMSPLNESVQTGGATIDVEISDTHLDSVQQKWDAGSWNSLNSPYDTSLPFGDGSHTLCVNATDEAGNYNYSVFIFTTDDTNPSVVLNFPSNETIHISGTAIDMSVSDINLDSVMYKWDIDSWSPLSSPYDTNLPIGEGSHILHINATDLTGNYNYSIFEFITDDLNPEIILNSPVNNTVYIGATMIDISVSDSNLAYVFYKWDTDSWNPWSSPYDTVLPFGDGLHILYVNGTDEAGNFNYTYYVFTTDDTNPSVVLSSPLNNSVYRSGATIDCSISDVNLLFVNYKWDISSWSEWFSPYDTILPMGEGEHTLFVNASDIAGNFNYSVYVFVTDDTEPTIILNSPGNNTIQRSSTNIDLSISDSNLDGVSFKWDSEVWQIFNSPYDTSTPVGDGDHILRVNASDIAGNWKVEVFVFTIDDLNPFIILHSPLNNSVQKSQTLVNVSVLDDDLDIVRYKWDNNDWVIWNSPYDTQIPENDGLHTLRINASDDAENSVNVTYSFITDDTLPVITLNSPNNNTAQKTGVLVDLFVSDLHLSLVMYRWDSAEWYELDAPYDTVLPSGDGSHVLEINATDEAGIQEIAQFIWTVDDSSPIITLVTPVNGTSILPESKIEFSVTDPYLNTCLYSWNESDAIVCLPISEIQAPSLEGFWMLRIVANDSLGNSRECLFTFRVTDPTPLITLVSPAMGGVYTPGTNVSILIDRAEEVLYNWDGSSNATSTLEIKIELPDSDGMHKLHIYARNLTYWKHDSFMFNTDGSPPSIELQSPQNNTVAISSSIIQFSISDNYEIDFVNYSWDSDESTSLESPYSLFLIEGEGSHILHVLAQDSVKNQVEVRYVFHTDDMAPAIILKAPMNGSICLSGFLVNFTVSDTNEFGVAVTWDNGEYTIIDEPYNSPVPAGDGWHHLSVHAIDEAGNTNVTKFAFLADNTAPDVEITSPSSPTLFNQVFTLTWTVTDASSCMSTVYVDNERVVTTTETARSLELSLGQHEIEVAAIDQVGNRGSDSTIITIMRDFEISITPTNGSLVSNTFSLNVSIALNNPAISINDVTISAGYEGSWVQLERVDESFTFTHLIDTTSISNGILSIQIRVAVENEDMTYVLEVMVNNGEGPADVDPVLLIIFSLVVIPSGIIAGLLLFRKFKRRNS